MATRKKSSAKTADNNIFEMMAEKFPANEKTIETEAGPVTVRSRIGIEELLALVNLIVEMCIDANTGEVKWEIYDFTSKLMVCATYCNASAPKDLETGYQAVCGEGRLYDAISAAIDKDQLRMIHNSTWNKLEARERLNTSTAVGKLNEFLENVQGLINMISGMSEGFDSDEALKALQQLSGLSMGKPK